MTRFQRAWAVIFFNSISPVCRVVCIWTHGKGARLCRVFRSGHTAKEHYFAVYFLEVHGKILITVSSRTHGRRQVPLLCRVSGKTHGKVLCRVHQQYTRHSPFAVPLYAVLGSPCVYTRQMLCRVSHCLCRVFCIHGKERFSRSVMPNFMVSLTHLKIRFTAVQ